MAVGCVFVWDSQLMDPHRYLVEGLPVSGILSTSPGLAYPDVNVKTSMEITTRYSIPACASESPSNEASRPSDMEVIP